ncbi:beta-microseminoprotein-like [Mytilus trossulus]|uniref:beta-microseminoprotein-like n=1 Tax=Mytilus trossulus TaxID=6551 RepID=UPI0030063598
MKTTTALACAIIMCLVIGMVDSYCGSITSPGNNPTNCTYGGVVVALNSTFTDYKACHRISCNTDGSMFVCGIGFHAGVFGPPPGCIMIQGDKCEALLVDVMDHTKKCDPTLYGGLG